MSIESKWTIGAMASKKASASSPVKLADRGGKRRRGEGTGGDDDAVPFRRRQAGDLVADDRHQRMAGEGRGDRLGEAVAVDGQARRRPAPDGRRRRA